MANLVQRLRSGRDLERQNPWPSVTFDQLPMWLGQFGYQGLGYGPALIQTYQANREAISADFMGFVKGAYKSNGPIFALMAFRLLMFSEARFQFRRMVNGRPGQLFGTAALEPLEHPWQNGTTGDLLARAITDVDIAGNFYATRVPGPKRGQVRIVRLRPDWVVIVLGSMEDTSVATYDPTAELIGYIYNRGGPGSGLTPHLYLPDEVAHFCVDEETEILTGEGWKSVDDLAVGDETLTLNHETGMAEWQAVSDVCIFDEQEREMISMEGREHSSLTTPGHRWSTEYKIARSGTFGKRWTTSSELAAGGSTGVRVPVAAPNGDLPKQATWPDALVELVAWYWTEGCSARDGKSLSIIQSLVVNDENAQRIQGALTSLFGAPRADRTLAHDVARWRKGICGNNCIFTLNGAASRGIFEHVKGKEKIVSTSFLRSLTQAQLELFIKISLLADNNGPRRLKQASKLRSDQFALACLLAGYGVSIREDNHGMTGVRILKKRHFYLIERPRGFHVKTVKHTGRVWCPRTPNQTWLARRRGAVYFTGNSPYVDPTAHYRGISWLEPVLQEVLADRAMNTHRLQYFNNGACLTLGMRLATPTGWTTMGEIAVGDEVLGADGKPTRVLGVYPQGERDVYRVTFAGGVSVECDAEHLWQVQTLGQRRGIAKTPHQVRSLESIRNAGTRYPSGPCKFAIPLSEPVEYEETAPLPLDPYLLGALLGDGHISSRTVSLASHRDDAPWMMREFRERLPSSSSVLVGCRYRRGLSAELTFTRKLGGPRENWLMGRLRELRLGGKLCYEKTIPEQYMRASVEDRIALLQGLIDTDGHITVGQEGVRFTSTSLRMAEQVAELAESLGGIASVKTRIRKDSPRPQGAVYFSRLPDWIEPVRLPRKRAQYRLSRSKRFIDRTRALKAIEYAGRKAVQCITVAAPDGLYLTEHFIVTHNSPNLVVSMETGKMDRKSFLEWIKLFESEHEGVANAYKCNAADTEVALWNGARCRADEIQVGDAIVSWTAEGRPAPGIVVRNDRQPASPIYTIRTARGRVIRVTDQHPFLLQGGVNRGARRTRSGWIEAKDLKPGDRLVVGLGWGRPRCQDVLTRDEAWMMGLLVGDGCFVSSTASVSASEPSIVARLGGIATLSPHQWRDQVLVSYYVSGISKMVRRLDLNGKRSWEKRVPTEVMTGGAEVVAAFLSGYIDADGHVADPERRRSAEIGLTSTSRELLEDVRHLLASVGVNASISAPLSMRPGRGDFQNARQGYRLGVFGNDQARLLSDLLDLAHEEKARRLEAYSQIAARRDGSQVDRVESITIDPPEETIGLQVDPYHTHVTGGVVTKNTLYLGQGAQAQVVGNDLKQMDFKIVQGAGESRLAAAAGIPPVLVGFSEGLSAATYCLPADELVWTAQGPREICEIRAGDRVWSWVNDAPALRPVTWQGQTGVEHVYELRTKNRAFRATGSHPVLTVDGSWRRLDSLQAGDRVLEPLGLPDQGQTALPDGKPATGEVMQWLGAIIGDGSRVPGWVFELSEDLRLAFLAGVVDTDGSVDRRGALKIQQANRLLVEDLRMLMVTCGIQCSNIAEIRYGPECLPNSGAQDEYRAWMFTASSAVEVARIPFADLVYRERVEVNQHRHRPNTIGFRIRSITRSRAAVPVYDIEVDEGHSFLASGVVVHNSNYAMARRRLADMTLRPLWRNFCSSMETLITPPRGSQLWYDDRDIPALQEDVKDEAEIALTRATALKMLTDAGYTGDSAVMAVESNDFTVLEHSGLFSVQLLPPGTPKNSNGGPPHGGGTSSNQPGQQPSTLSNGTTPNTPSIGGGGSGSEGSGSGQSSVRLPPGVERATLSGNAEDLARAILAARARGEIPDD